MPGDQPPSDTARAEKVLSCICIDGNGPLSLEATKEYQANESRQFTINGVSLPNNRDLPAIIKHFDQLWKIQIKSGLLATTPMNGNSYTSTALLATSEEIGGEMDFDAAGDEPECQVNPTILPK